jgi:flagellar basal body rod protein FlgG
MTDILGIAGTAIAAYGVRQGVTANNMANLNTAGFNASSVAMRENRGGGVTAGAIQGADSVDISKEATDMLNSEDGCKANLKVVRVADEMTKELLDMVG